MTSPNFISFCSRLNDDILREIFIHCVSDTGEFSKCFILDKYTPSIRIYPQLSVSRVCSSWRHVALFTPQLWNNVMIRWLTESSLNIARRYLSHARKLPVSITLGPMITGWEDLYPMLSFLSSYQLRSLTFPARVPHFHTVLHDLPEQSIETLESLSLFIPEEIDIDLINIKYPKLAFVSISGAYKISGFSSSLRIFHGWSLSMTVIEGWDLLRRCPLLEEVRLRMAQTPDDGSHRLAPESHIYHQHLRTLIFKSTISDAAPFGVFIAALALPSLEKMHLYNAWSVTAFQSLAQRSNHFPNLTDFLLDIPTSDMDVGTLFASMPSVTRVFLDCDGFEGTITFDQRTLDGLASGSLAPRLQCLEGRISNGKQFMDMVESRMINAEMSGNGVPTPFTKVEVAFFGSDVARVYDMQRQGIPISKYFLWFCRHPL